MSPCHSRQPSVISDASAAEGDRSSTPSDINSPRHRTHSLCNVRPAAAGPRPWAPLETSGVGVEGWRPTHCFLSSTQGAFWRRHFLFCSFLLQEEMDVGRERNEACWLLVSGRARKIQRKAGLGRTQGLSSLGLPVVGCVWDHGRLLPDYLPSSGSHHHHHSHFPVEPALGPLSRNQPDFFLFNLQEFLHVLLLERHPVNLF